MAARQVKQHLRRMRALLPWCVLLAARLAAAAPNDTVYQRDHADGAVELTNVPGDSGYELAVAAPASRSQPEPPAAQVDTVPAATAGSARVGESSAPALAPDPSVNSGAAGRMQMLYQDARNAHSQH